MCKSEGRAPCNGPWAGKKGEQMCKSEYEFERLKNKPTIKQPNTPTKPKQANQQTNTSHKQTKKQTNIHFTVSPSQQINKQMNTTNKTSLAPTPSRQK
jgi:hypothetical protein